VLLANSTKIYCTPDYHFYHASTTNSTPHFLRVDKAPVAQCFARAQAPRAAVVASSKSSAMQAVESIESDLVLRVAKSKVWISV
jgi:hypothetical protein